MFKQVDYVMITVSDMSRSVQFYRDKLGLPLRFESKEWTEFETGATTLALHGGGKPWPQTGESQEHYSGTCSIGFNVENLDKTFRELESKGVKFVMPPTKREGEGIELAVGLDPDGLPVSFAQTLQKRK